MQGVWQGGVGQPFTQIAPEASVSVCPSVNDSNQIAYVTPTGVIRASNGSLTTLATSAAFPFANGYRTYVPSIASDGRSVNSSSGSRTLSINVIEPNRAPIWYMTPNFSVMRR